MGAVALLYLTRDNSQRAVRVTDQHDGSFSRPAPTRVQAIEQVASAPVAIGLADDELGLKTCDEYRKRFAACARLPARTRQVFLRSFAPWKRVRTGAERGEWEGWETVAEHSCERAGNAWRASLEMLGC